MSVMLDTTVKSTTVNTNILKDWFKPQQFAACFWIPCLVLLP